MIDNISSVISSKYSNVGTYMDLYIYDAIKTDDIIGDNRSCPYCGSKLTQIVVHSELVGYEYGYTVAECGVLIAPIAGGIISLTSQTPKCLIMADLVRSITDTI